MCVILNPLKSLSFCLGSVQIPDMIAKQTQKEVGAVLFLGRACSEGRVTASQVFGFPSCSSVYDILEMDRWMDGWMGL